jgi:TRAP-type C4-dicarboxylate transport system permease small subunit
MSEGGNLQILLLTIDQISSKKYDDKCPKREAFEIIMVCVTTVDTVGRYFLNSPIPGSYEVTEKYLMIFAIFFALGLAYRDGAHIRLTFVTNHLRPGKLKLVFNYAAQVVTILFNIFLFLASTKTCIIGFNEIWDATKFRLHMWPAYLVVVLGLFFACLWMFADLWQVKKGKSCLLKGAESAKTEEATLV